ncbi:MAG: hypothetical protein ACLFO1_07750 [Spirochaetaceae bacterium]
MKEVLSATGRFLAILFVVLLIVVGVAFLLGAIPIWSGAVQASAATFLALAVDTLRDTWLATGALGVIAWLFSLLRRIDHRFISRLVVFMLASVIFLSGGIVIRTIAQGIDEPPPGVDIVPGRYYHTGDGFLYLGSREGLAYRGGVRLRTGDPPRMNVLGSARQDPRAGTLTIPATGERLNLGDFNSVYWNETAPPAEFRGFFRNAATISTAWIQDASVDSPSYLAFGIVLMALCMSSWSIVRISRWPLLNAFLVVLLMWGVVGLLSLDVRRVMFDLMGDGLPGTIRIYLPHVLLAALAVIFTLINIFQPPFRKWQRNVVGG